MTTMTRQKLLNLDLKAMTILNLLDLMEEQPNLILNLMAQTLTMTPCLLPHQTLTTEACAETGTRH